VFKLITSPIASYSSGPDPGRRGGDVPARPSWRLWLLISFTGYTLLVWPSHAERYPAVPGQSASARATKPWVLRSGSSPICSGDSAIIVTFADRLPATLVLSVQPARERGVAADARAGAPSWGRSCWARTHYALGSGASTIDTLPDCGVAGGLGVRPRRRATPPTCAGVVPLPPPAVILGDLAAGVLDSAALYLALSPSRRRSPGPAVLAFRVHMPKGDSAGDGIRHTRRAYPDAGHHPQGYQGILDAVARAAQGGLPHRSATPLTHGPTSSAGESTMSRLPTRWLRLDLCPRYGRAPRAGPPPAITPFAPARLGAS